MQTFTGQFYVKKKMVMLGSQILIPVERKAQLTAHIGAKTLTHPYKYTLTPPVISSQQLSVLN